MRVIGGPFDSIKGPFLKVKGVRNRRIVIRIGEVTAVAMAEISPDLIEILSDEC